VAPATLVGSTLVCECGATFVHAGRGQRCNDCYNRRQRERLAADPEKTRDYHREWARKNPDKVKAKRDKHQSTPEYREAQSERNRSYYEDNQERLRTAALERAPIASIVRYGITAEQFNEMLARQNGVCAICGQDNTRFGKRLAIDHDHDTGDVRGLLCNSCNGALGLFKDDVDTLKKAIEYLQKGRG
jgi:hypothetical protein